MLIKRMDILSDQAKIVLFLYYYDDLTMREIGKILDITESRVCQIHSLALKKLKKSSGKGKIRMRSSNNGKNNNCSIRRKKTATNGKIKPRNNETLTQKNGKSIHSGFPWN